ncbi:hypothetical protein U8335_25235 [Roseiconus lacunae]|uniref:hypothetical protein n=1 Tax=Roseiconus lacunae TaxID=2605694 RepID=UPI00308C8A7C|nr:hypothetical protein U8335_25235 [Stieleria sp. HD01]
MQEKKKAEKEAKQISKLRAAERRQAEKSERKKIRGELIDNTKRIQPEEPPELPITTNHLNPPAVPVETKTECPFCAEVISVNAKKCKHCGEFLDPVLRASMEGSRSAAGPQIVNVVHGGNATATASAEASSSISEGCSGCLTLIFIVFLILLCAGIFGGG